MDRFHSFFSPPKQAFWAKTGPFRAPWGSEGARYQFKVCGNHESNTDEPIGESWDQIWPPADRGPPGPPKGPIGAVNQICPNLQTS